MVKPFYTKPNKEIYMVKKIVKKVTGNSAKLNCRGGTSDSRFLGSIPRLELGLKILPFIWLMKDRQFQI